MMLLRVSHYHYETWRSSSTDSLACFWVLLLCFRCPWGYMDDLDSLGFMVISKLSSWASPCPGKYSEGQCWPARHHIQRKKSCRARQRVQEATWCRCRRPGRGQVAGLGTAARACTWPSGSSPSGTLHCILHRGYLQDCCMWGDNT